MSQPGPHVTPLINLSSSIVSGGTFTQHNQIYTLRSGERAGYTRLAENVAPAALHDSVHVFDPPKCHPNTRVAIIESIIGWTLGLNTKMSGKPIIWLKGAAGAGKSAIARSVAERCSKEGLLLGNFFFGAADSTRNHVGRLVATLSYQVCTILPEYRKMVSTLIEDDPLLFHRSLSTQFMTMLVRPLSMILANDPGIIKTPRLVIIDGLDECSASVDSQRDLLLALQEATSATTLIRFLVCSRPEIHLNSAFGLPCMANIHCKIFLDEDYSAEQDIRLFLEDKFKQLKGGHAFKHTLPAMWPSAEIIDNLVNKSSGQFIYAATVVKYVESPRHRPHQRLEAIFYLRPAFKDLPFTELDALYRHIISKAEDLPKVLAILAFPALYDKPFPAEDIEAMLELEHGDVEVMLADLQSIITVCKTRDHPNRRTRLQYQMNAGVKFLHKSFIEFISEPQRAGELYQDLSAVRLHHVARSISFVSIDTFQQQQSLQPRFSYRAILQPIEDTLENLGNGDNDYVSPAILQAARQVPTFNVTKQSLLYSGMPNVFFLNTYLGYLYAVKDVADSARPIYLEHIRQYCGSIISVLEDDLADDWEAHFIYAYYHLLPFFPPQYLLSRTLFRGLLVYIDAGTFGTAIIFMWLYGRYDAGFPYLDDILQKSYDLTKGIKQDTIFALSASFCLAFLCDKRSTSRDARRITKVMGIDQRKRREHPWRWRRMNPRGSLRDQLVIWSNRYGQERLGKMRRLLYVAGLDEYTNKIFTVREYLKKQKLAYKPERRQGWPLYMLLLDIVPCILPFSGRYEPLVTICRKKCFASLSQYWPKKTRRARQAIENYLRRVDA
ncbi:hypothetical protein CPC08DRAFT_663231 [Agrocybe pediades]|nr:hypothetical protein CPC08DRAFT_663231 [Agrocybe pediades]